MKLKRKHGNIHSLDYSSTPGTEPGSAIRNMSGNEIKTSKSKESNYITSTSKRDVLGRYNYNSIQYKMWTIELPSFSLNSRIRHKQPRTTFTYLPPQNDVTCATPHPVL